MAVNGPSKLEQPIINGSHIAPLDPTSQLQLLQPPLDSGIGGGGERRSQSLIFRSSENVGGVQPEEAHLSPTVRVRVDLGCADVENGDMGGKTVRAEGDVDSLCIVCTEREADAVLLECGHR